DIITVKTLEYSVPNNLEILFNNGNGEFVQNPVSGISNNTIKKNYATGTHTIKWNAYNSFGNSCESGVYFARLGINGKTQKTVKLIKLN
ncbi:MAG: hypothetical protein B7C24_08385, partial [Bacteroidetes bacterium 4572_77]